MRAVNKRIFGEYNLGEVNLAEFVDPKNPGAIEIFNVSVKKFIELNNQDNSWMDKANKYGLECFLVAFGQSIINVEIAYRPDTETVEKTDCWFRPNQTWAWKKGDCEDTTFLSGSFLEIVLEFCEAGKYFATLGYYRTFDNKYYGHGYILLQLPYYKKWLIIETTLDREISPFIWLNWNPETYIPAVAFNRKEELIMTIKRDREKLGLSEAWYQRHQAQIQQMIDYIQTGKPLPYHYMHKTIRPVPINQNDLVDLTKKLSLGRSLLAWLRKPNKDRQFQKLIRKFERWQNKNLK